MDLQIFFHMRCAIITLGRNIEPKDFPGGGPEGLRIAVSHAHDGHNDGPGSVVSGGSSCLSLMC